MPGQLEIFRKNKSRFRFSAGQSESGKALSCIYPCEIMPASDFACSGFLSVSYAVFLTAGNPTVIFPAVWLCRVLLRQLLSVQVNSRFPRQALLLSWQVQAYCPVYRGWRSPVREAVTGSGIAGLAAWFPLAGENPVRRRHRAGNSQLPERLQSIFLRWPGTGRPALQELLSAALLRSRRRLSYLRLFLHAIRRLLPMQQLQQF